MWRGKLSIIRSETRGLISETYWPIRCAFDIKSRKAMIDGTPGLRCILLSLLPPKQNPNGGCPTRPNATAHFSVSEHPAAERSALDILCSAPLLQVERPLSHGCLAADGYNRYRGWLQPLHCTGDRCRAGDRHSTRVVHAFIGNRAGLLAFPFQSRLHVPRLICILTRARAFSDNGTFNSPLHVSYP